VLLGWLIGLPLAVGAVVALADLRPAGPRGTGPRGAVVAGVGVVAAATVTTLSVIAAATRPQAEAALFAGIRAGWAVDALSAVLVVTVAVATLAVLVFAAGEPELRTGRFTGVMLLFAGSMLATVTATSLAPLLMAWEVMGAASWALIGYAHRDPATVGAAHTAFLTTRFGDLGLYLAAGAALAGGAAALALDQLAGVAAGWREVVAAGVVAAALGKSAQLPFAFWLSGAMRGPSPVSALLHSATMVAAGAYLLLRTSPLLGAVGWAGPLVAWTGALTALGLGLVAVAQRDVKQLLAASTCAQIGYMVLAAGAASAAAGTAATAAGALQLVAHAATKSLLFLAAGAWLTALGTRRLDHLDGAARRFPLVGVTFTVGALSLAGIPPLSLWVAKDAVLAAALTSALPGAPALYAVGLAGAAVAAVYSAKAVWFVWRPARAVPDTAPGQEPTGQVPRPAAPPLVVLAAGAAGLGMLPLVGPTILATDPPAAWELALSAVVAAAAAGWAWRRGGRLPAPALLRDWLRLEPAARALVVRPVLAVARGLARFDDRVLDRAVDDSARATVRLGRGLDRRGEGAVDGTVRGLAGAVRVLGRWARRPQTGQLHQYYAQASVAFALLAALAVVVVVVG
jgi:NADH:ubiquinone oxidoreductase subunit 5 (subunit L)/multisubunit Na+/H+ antiporter MnhA subunit